MTPLSTESILCKYTKNIPIFLYLSYVRKKYTRSTIVSEYFITTAVDVSTHQQLQKQ